METLIQGWLSIWLYVMSAIAIMLVYQIYKNRNTWSKLNILCTIAIIVLVLHVLEEWVFPGGLHYSYNLSHGSDILSSYPMNRLTDMITNFGGVVLGCLVLKFHGFGKPAGISIMLFSLFEVFIHVSIGIQDMRIFSEFGMNTLYSPGLVTSLFGFLPVAILIGFELFRKKADRPNIKQWISAVAVMFALCFLLINLPENLLGNKNTSYEFTNRGFYDQYSEQFEKDRNIKY